MSCQTWTILFYATVACAVLATGATALAWRDRRPHEAASRWLVDPTILFRPSLFNNPKSAARKVALVLLLGGVLLALAVGAPAVAAVLGGESGFCSDSASARSMPPQSVRPIGGRPSLTLGCSKRLRVVGPGRRSVGRVLLRA